VEFVEAAGSLLSRMLVDPSLLKDYNVLQELHKRLVKSADHLESREDNLGKDETKLNMLEDRLLQTEISYYGPTTRSYHSFSFDEGHVRSPESPSEDEPELIRRYHERQREANSLRDDIVNFSAEYQRAMDKRSARRMRGETIKLSEYDFLKKYSRKRKTRLRRFESARKDVLRLREECIESGFTVGDPDIPPFNEELCPDPLSLIPEPVIEYVSSLDRSAGDQKRSDDLLVKDPDTKARITTWVSQVAYEHDAVARKHHSDSEILGNNKHRLSSAAQDLSWLKMMS